jgi:hypothetical protein
MIARSGYCVERLVIIEAIVFGEQLKLGGWRCSRGRSRMTDVMLCVDGNERV